MKALSIILFPILAAAASTACSAAPLSCSAGGFYGPSVTTLSPTSSTGFDITSASNSSNYTLYQGNPSLWGNLQPGGFAEYTVSVAVAGPYAVKAYYSTAMSGAGADLLVNGVRQTNLPLANTADWNSFQLSGAATVMLPSGTSLLRIAAQASFQPFNLQGLLVTPVTAASTPPATPVTTTKPVTVLNATGATAVDITSDSGASGYSLYRGTPSLWGNLQTNGYVEYTVSSASPGSYALQLSYSTTMSGGGTNVSVNGVAQRAANLPSTGAWGTFLVSASVPLNLGAGTSVIRLAAATPFQAFNLEGMSLTSVVASSSYPLAGAKFFVSPYSASGQNVAASCSAIYPGSTGLIAKLAAQAQGVWFGSWNVNVQADAAVVAKAAMAQSASPIIVAYNIPHRDCSGFSSGGSQGAAAYQSWIRGLALGLGSVKAVVVLEPDALSQLQVPGCLDQTSQNERLSLLNYAVSMFKQYAPNSSVYLDAGHTGAIDPNVMAQNLQYAGVAAANGFALNTSNYETTSANESYGQQISALIGGKHFVIDTSRNGLGPTSDHQWCNPADRGAGLPAQGFGFGLVDAHVWAQNPGSSDGSCNGAPPAGTFSVPLACTLAHNATF